MKLNVSFDNKFKSFDLTKVDYDVNTDKDGFKRLHVYNKISNECELNLSLRRDVTISIVY